MGISRGFLLLIFFSFSSHLSVDLIRVVNHSSLRILRPETEVKSNFASDSWVVFETLRYGQRIRQGIIIPDIELKIRKRTELGLWGGGLGQRKPALADESCLYMVSPWLGQIL
jgi:hypothetical protein